MLVQCTCWVTGRLHVLMCCIFAVAATTSAAAVWVNGCKALSSTVLQRLGFVQWTGVTLQDNCIVLLCIYSQQGVLQLISSAVCYMHMLPSKLLNLQVLKQLCMLLCNILVLYSKVLAGHASCVPMTASNFNKYYVSNSLVMKDAVKY